MAMIAGHRLAGIGQASNDHQDRLMQLVQFIAAIGHRLKVVERRKIWQVTSSIDRPPGRPEARTG